MKVVIQKVLFSSVEVEGKTIGEIRKGLNVLVGFTQGDNEEKVKWMASKIVNLRIFEDKNDVMNLSLKDVGGDILTVSQFTLYADAIKGNRPSYMKALGGEESIILYDKFNKELEHLKINVETGEFGASMKVNILNDGPTTIIIEK
jgi:D-tyrosyl-tRNA(Tyr) deacylase